MACISRLVLAVMNFLTVCCLLCRPGFLSDWFALQEILLILEECWNNSPELQNVPIYQASGLARRAISVYQTYIEMMNDDIKAAFQVCSC